MANTHTLHTHKKKPLIGVNAARPKKEKISWRKIKTPHAIFFLWSFPNTPLMLPNKSKWWQILRVFFFGYAQEVVVVVVCSIIIII